MLQSTAAAIETTDGEGTMQTVSRLTSSQLRLRKGKARLPLLSREAKARLKWIDYYHHHGRNISLTCRHFGIARSTFYRWIGRYDPFRLETLEDRSSQPKRKRRRSWTLEQVEAVRRAREHYPRWGKDKLKRVLEAGDVSISVSMVGRILAYLKSRGLLREPIRAVKTRQRRWKRPYGVRKPRDYHAQSPGDLVQIDTLEVQPATGVVLKQFTARDVVSRWDALELAGKATAFSAKRALASMLERIPFPVKALQVDGGSEFMAEFEEDCRARGIRLFVLPPRSPKLNGAVERANRTHTEEFHHFSTANPTVLDLGAELRQWEAVYNTIRPHQALGYLTPKQFIDQWLQQNQPREVL